VEQFNVRAVWVARSKRCQGAGEVISLFFGQKYKAAILLISDKRTKGIADMPKNQKHHGFV
jgi:hypothetical protein